MIPIFISYLFYFFIIPGFIGFGVWKLWDETEFLHYFEKRKTNIKNKKIINEKKKDIKRIQIYFVLFLIISLPTWGFFSSEISDSQMSREVHGVGFGAFVTNPVVESLGPSYDSEKIIDKMRSNPSVWLPIILDEVVNIDKVTKYPGRLAVYRLIQDRYVITYTYLAPFPITKSYGIELIDTGDEDYKILSRGEQTVVFPLNPGDASSVVPKTTF